MRHQYLVFRTYYVTILMSFRYSRTVITIAHRLSTVRHCDRIAVIEGGVLTELASHDELLAFKGSYYRLWQQQINFSTEEMK